MVDESVCYHLVSQHYDNGFRNKNDSKNYKKEMAHLFSALGESIERKDKEQKNEIIELIIKLEKSMQNILEEDDEIHKYFLNQVRNHVYAIANNFGYNEMVKNIERVYGRLKNSQYEKMDLYKIPLEKMKFWDDQLLIGNGYFDDIKRIDFLEEYESGYLKVGEVREIFFWYFKNIIENQVCTKNAKDLEVENYLDYLTRFYQKSRDEKTFPVDAINIIDIWYRYVLNNENVEERNNIFNKIINKIYFNNYYGRNAVTFDTLSLMLQSFYAYAFCETEMLTAGYRTGLKETFIRIIPNKGIEDMKAPVIVKRWIKYILIATGKRITDDFRAIEDKFECFTQYAIAKKPIWTEAFDSEFFFMLYVIYYDKTRFLPITEYVIGWNELDNKKCRGIMSCFLRMFDKKSGKLKDDFYKCCKEFGGVLEHIYEIGDEEQRTLYDSLNKEGKNLIINREEGFLEEKPDKKIIYGILSDSMEEDKIYGWNKNYSNKNPVIYNTPWVIYRKEDISNRNIAKPTCPHTWHHHK